MSQFIILFFLLVVINAETCPEILSTCSSCSKDSDGNYVCSDCVSDCILINSSCIIPERGDEKCRCPSYSKVVDGVCVCNNNRYYDSAKGICQKCTNNNPQCSSCNETNGECTSCKNPYVLDEKTKLCVSGLFFI
ncbi:CXXC-rich protein [Entamoeba nuttalli P19]|uniref:CXXC-rich protein n=1 Tax=Entamoeba nuttalli (strain P19) TaxID=1076696 RepID=K2GX38_ENTNP|nr:CXXC-rich protein [Entamoeba nuttalli P19]EKE38362.1 CXXC-rich protein [Entamoeba nuttalli P19]|eukprot:XP_008859304.1 CXXC-rich protein [Entamoeba nuttalli P19]